MGLERDADEETTVTVLTPRARGAIATVSLEGPRAWDIVSRLFYPVSPQVAGARPRPDEPAAERILFGRWGSAQGEEVVLRRRSPTSLELHCHGGLAASDAIVATLQREGCRPLEWPAAFASRDGDPIATQARLALAEARTERAARILLWQFTGALRRALEEIDRRVASNDLAGALAAVRMLIARAGFGRHLVEPWRVVLAGPPNVGKSSLINALVGYARSIVYDMPGTTRDVVTASAALDGWPVELSDTAGLRRRGDALEQAGVQLAREQLASADLAVLVFDATQNWSADDAALAAAWPNALLVHNKCDLAIGAAGARPPGICTSALLGQGLPELEQQIARRLVPCPPALGDAVPFAADQVDTLLRVLALLERGETSAARQIFRGFLRPNPPASDCPA